MLGCGATRLSAECDIIWIIDKSWAEICIAEGCDYLLYSCGGVLSAIVRRIKNRRL